MSLYYPCIAEGSETIFAAEKGVKATVREQPRKSDVQMIPLKELYEARGASMTAD